MEVVGAGEEGSFAACPIKAKDGFLVEAVDLIDGGNFLEAVALE